ncbi:MAG: hypothetical protein JWN00_2467 [Actinomycetia bacterium]|nr:hypothetical protein [Actinomycetes bacterium]
MRRTLGPILIGLGAFFLTLAPMTRFYVADQLIVAPTDFYQKTTLRAEHATFFDGSKVKLRKDVSLVAVQTVRGDPTASTASTALWDTFTSITDPDSGADIAIRQARYAVNRRTGELSNCCGASIGQDTSVRQSGLGFIWPLANVQKRTYAYFDPSTRQAWPIEYQGEDTVQGLRAYRFVQTIPETRVGTLPGLPAKLLGLPVKRGNLNAVQYYQATVTIWVDPRTGVPVSQREQVRSSARGPDGTGSLVLVEADLRTQAADEKALINLSDGYAWQFAAVRDWIPVGSLVFGLFLLASGVLQPLFERGGSRDRRTGSHSKAAEAVVRQRI